MTAEDFETAMSTLKGDLVTREQFETATQHLVESAQMGSEAIIDFIPTAIPKSPLKAVTDYLWLALGGALTAWGARRGFKSVKNSPPGKLFGDPKDGG